MEHWITTIEGGNHCFSGGDWVEARELYLQALAEAQLMYGRWSDHDMAVAAFVISHHNLADLDLALNHPEGAVEHLCISHEQLLLTATDESLPDGLRKAALRHAARTYQELLQFTAHFGASARIDRLLAAYRNLVCQSKTPRPCQPGRLYH